MDELFILAVYDWCLFILMSVPSVFKLNAVLLPINLALSPSLSFQNCECHRGLHFETGNINVFSLLKHIFSVTFYNSKGCLATYLYLFLFFFDSLRQTPLPLLTYKSSLRCFVYLSPRYYRRLLPTV